MKECIIMRNGRREEGLGKWEKVKDERKRRRPKSSYQHCNAT
jgi:hypothetical protein